MPQKECEELVLSKRTCLLSKIRTNIDLLKFQFKIFNKAIFISIDNPNFIWSNWDNKI